MSLHTRRASVLVLGAALALSGCGSRSDNARATAFGDPGVAHVHGLGVDPADGTLYAATHTGIFILPTTGKAKRIADRYQDTMGFTVVGPHRFLGSGHPDQQDDELHVAGTRPLLGLIESTDAGATWKKQSLFGDADFHTLVSAHGRIYGYDSTGGRLLVSVDKKTWETVNDSVELGMFVVSPTDPDLIVATVDTGVVSSTDGGRTFSPLADAPGLVVLSWDADRGLWGADEAGNVYRTTAPNEAWSMKGRLAGEPEALLVTDDALYAAVMSPAGRTSILRSGDDGRTWRLRYKDPG